MSVSFSVFIKLLIISMYNNMAFSQKSILLFSFLFMFFFKRALE